MEERKKTLWNKIKGYFLIAGTVAVAAKGTAALTAEHIVSKHEEQKRNELKEKWEAVERHKAIYPCQKKCIPQSSLDRIKTR